MERGNTHKQRVKSDTLPVKYGANNYHIIFMLSLLGATEQAIADCLGVSLFCIHYHKENTPEFWEAMQRGRTAANAKVAEGLYLNCIDRYVDDESIHVWKGEVIRVPYKRFVAGDKWAQVKWLATKDRENWSESQNININKVNTNVNIDLTGITMEEMLMLEKMGLKQLPEHNING